MTQKIRLSLFTLFLIFVSNVFLAQTTTTQPAKEEDEFAKKKAETKLTEVIPTDSIPAGELLKRAVAWIKVDSDKYKKSSGTTTANKAECTASFPVKPKELNPEVNYAGKITMKIVIECKDSKYRYTVSEIKHISKTGKVNGGSIDNVVAECGSMAMNDIVWKRLKGEALKTASQVVVDLKTGMAQLVATDAKSDDEW